MLKLRRANEDDWPDIAEADRVCFPYDDPPEHGPGAVWWVARDEHGDLAGYCAAQFAATTPGAAFLSRAGVLPDFRGQRLQMRMVRARERWARVQGLTRVVTYTYLNPASANSLIACGYRMYIPAAPWSDTAACYWFKDL